MMISATLLLMALQIGPNPAAGAMPDYAAEVQDRAPRKSAGDTAGESVRAGEASPAPWLQTCLDQIATDPARAHVQAQIRRDASAGEARVLAQHCLGLAATRLERWDEARAAFVAARNDVPPADVRLRARLGAMAANAALGSGDGESALDLLAQAQDDASQARAARPLEAIIALDTARVLMALGRPDEAEAHLVRSRQLHDANPQSALLLATLLRRFERLDEARMEIEHAHRLAPLDPEIALEAGVIAMLAGREEAARQSWQAVLETGTEGLFAERARGYLAQLAPQTNAQADVQAAMQTDTQSGTGPDTGPDTGPGTGPGTAAGTQTGIEP